MANRPFKKCAVLGASRGLGFHLVEALSPQGPVLAVSRTQGEWTEAPGFEYWACDFSRGESIHLLVERLLEFAPEQIIYVAGGGPYGPFLQQKWASHQWALQVTFLTPALLLREVGGKAWLKQFLYVGSSVAEAQGDAYAASYAAAKHAWLGLHQSMIAELDASGRDVRLYSPGYMDTTLLPAGSWPRIQGKALWAPREVAQDLLQWASEVSKKNDHRKLSFYAEPLT
jgi:NAD(P)-dependent dehydrogenase (short-subunit alcohol dehydrogenase family)